ncbi:MFS transporter [Amycolatopsis rhizosphaerae]|uniref:MFS transporter n=1 Tax=Amycolatopsis rhizosphaerae TaxID=2053003 RepID=A0A558DHK8_9PSEU|nr:MFS transporter [Amycolatopsis rhizosphaerae]TVT60500.1 MFS transporter [Amycolatopsis rhizosphaerae]
MDTSGDVGARRRASWLLAAGAVLAVAAAITCFARAFSMSGMTDTPGSPASNPLHGMALSDMPEMWVGATGLLLVVAGIAGRGRPRRVEPPGRRRSLAVAVIGTAALTIDISKTSTLGFVIPGMRGEYGISAGSASFLAVAGLSGTGAGAIVFALLADRWGRRGTYLLATLGFTTTSMCGSMPSFAGNLAMCGLMGLAVGGLAPLLITLLTDALGISARGSVVVALSVVATAIGYLVAAGSALWLEPVFGWRVLWLIGVPTGLLLAALTPWVPEWAAAPAAGRAAAAHGRALTVGLQRGYAFLIGVLTFGLSTWVPTLTRSGGLAAGTANLWLTLAAVVMVPCAVLLMLGYRRFGPVRFAAGLAAATAVLLLALTATGVTASASWLCAGALVAALFSVNVMAAIFLPIAADLADPAGRGRFTGTVSLYNRLGGLCGPLLLATIVTSASDVLIAVAALAVCSAAAAVWIGWRQRLIPAQEMTIDGKEPIS